MASKESGAGGKGGKQGAGKKPAARSKRAGKCRLVVGSMDGEPIYYCERVGCRGECKLVLSAEGVPRCKCIELF